MQMIPRIENWKLLETENSDVDRNIFVEFCIS